MAGKLARREEGAMPLRIVTDEATPPDAPPRPCPRGLRRLSPAAASRRLGQYRTGYSRFACSLHQTKIIRNATPSGCGIGSRGDFDKANNPFMRCAMQENEFAKIFVERDQNAIFSNCDIEDFFVAGIGCKVACPPYIMPEFSELFRRRTPNAGVEKKSHAALGIGMGNIVSLETAARAYSREAKMSSRSSHG